MEIRRMQFEDSGAPAVKERLPLTDSVVIATNFLYKNYRLLPWNENRKDDDTDGVRGDLALEMIAKATEQGIRIVGCDGGSSPDFLSALEKFKEKGLTVVKSEVPKRAPQRRKAFEKAASFANGKVILYIQPEKIDIVKEENLRKVLDIFLEENADVAVLKRNPAQFQEFYPDYMVESETHVNEIYDERMKKTGIMRPDQSFDWFFGVLAFKNTPDVVSIFLKDYELKDSIKSRVNGVNPNPEKQSGNQYFSIIEALSTGKNVVSIEVNFVYPEKQKLNETCPENIENCIKRRKEDSRAYPLEAIHFLAFLRGDERSKIRPLLESTS